MSCGWRLILVGCWCCCCPLAVAVDDFAIKSQVFRGEEQEPIGENITIFRGSMIYDFNELAPHDVTVFDTKSRRFVLACPDRHVQTSLSLDDVLQFAAAEKARALGSTNEVVKFAVDPRFSESFDAPAGRLSLTSPVWDYIVDIQPVKDRELLRRYTEFANWYTFLNALFRPVPPDVRLELNRVLDQRGVLPQQVVVRIKRDQTVVVEQRSVHELVATLGPSELDRILDWEHSHKDYRSVDFSAYQATN